MGLKFGFIGFRGLGFGVYRVWGVWGFRVWGFKLIVRLRGL